MGEPLVSTWEDAHGDPRIVAGSKVRLGAHRWEDGSFAPSRYAGRAGTVTAERGTDTLGRRRVGVETAQGSLNVCARDLIREPDRVVIHGLDASGEPCSEELEIPPEDLAHDIRCGLAYLGDCNPPIYGHEVGGGRVVGYLLRAGVLERIANTSLLAVNKDRISEAFEALGGPVEVSKIEQAEAWTEFGFERALLGLPGLSAFEVHEDSTTPGRVFVSVSGPGDHADLRRRVMDELEPIRPAGVLLVVESFAQRDSRIRYESSVAEACEPYLNPPSSPGARCTIVPVEDHDEIQVGPRARLDFSDEAVERCRQWLNDPDVRRVAEILNPPIICETEGCGQPVWKQASFCPDCLQIMTEELAEGIREGVRKIFDARKVPAKPAEGLDRWTSRPLGTVGERWRK